MMEADGPSDPTKNPADNNEPIQVLCRLSWTIDSCFHQIWGMRDKINWEFAKIMELYKYPIDFYIERIFLLLREYQRGIEDWRLL